MRASLSPEQEREEPMIAVVVELLSHLTPQGLLASGPNYTYANILAAGVILIAASGAAFALKKK
jgi:hypothetical protein